MCGFEVEIKHYAKVTCWLEIIPSYPRPCGLSFCFCLQVIFTYYSIYIYVNDITHHIWYFVMKCPLKTCQSLWSFLSNPITWVSTGIRTQAGKSYLIRVVRLTTTLPVLAGIVCIHHSTITLTYSKQSVSVS